MEIILRICCLASCIIVIISLIVLFAKLRNAKDNPYEPKVTAEDIYRIMFTKDGIEL